MKKMTVNRWRGLSSVFTFLLVVMLSLSILANANAMLINSVLGVTTSAANYGNGDVELSDEGYNQLIQDSYEFCDDIEREGAVLLMNDGALPLTEDERNVTLFGRGSADIIYRSTAGGPITNEEYEVTLDKAFEGRGFTINRDLFDAYTGVTSTRSTTDVGEVPPEFYTSALKDTFASYGDVAIVTLSRFGTEGQDVGVSGDGLMLRASDGKPMLALDPNEIAMFNMIQESNVFKKTIVLLNSVFPIECGSLADLGVDAVLWIGNPGYYGLGGVVDLLTGAANPSGHIFETYAANSLSAPAMANFGLHKFDYSNVAAPTEGEHADGFVNYAEGIYVGYKYYETRYADTILNQGNAVSAKGSSDGAAWNYANEVVYPFGYGLSYTQFTQTLDDVSYNPDDDTITATVTVTNNGNMDGKSVVQVYASLPYTDYDRQNNIEKAAIQLINYDKVELAAGESTTIEIPFDRYLLASYDANNAKGYILEPGDYYIALGNGAHEAVNNVLAAQGATGLVDQDGNPVTGDTNAVKVYNPQLDTIDTESYKQSVYNADVEVTNEFDDVSVNYWLPDDQKVPYLSRADWDATWPVTMNTMTVTEDMKQAMNSISYTKPEDAPTVDEVPHGVHLDERINFLDMVGVPYDDPKWDTFIQQMSIEDLAISIGDARGINAVASVNKPMNAIAEGPEGLLARFKYGDGRNCTGFGTMPLIASSFNPEHQHKYGNMYGEEALYSGVAMANAPGANIIRTPYGGRASEYFSEDAMLAFRSAQNVVNGMYEKGLIANIKHCFLNNQETYRQGVATFANEQSIREIYLRPFEGVIADGEGMGIMTSYNRIGLKYAAVNSVLMQNVMRGEWGYEGNIIDDAMSECAYAPTAEMLVAGTDVFCLDAPRSASITNLIESNDDGFLLEQLQEANHRLMYTLLQSSMGYQSTDSVSITTFAWWQGLIIGIDAVLALATIACLVMYLRNEYGKKKQQEEQS